MKATLGTEATDRRYRLEARGIVVHQERPWVAEITAPDPRFGYQRRFLPHKVDYRGANSRATRGVWWWWVIESGRVYEVSRLEGGQIARRFITVDQDGDIVGLTREEVDRWLRSAGSASMS